jgi:hypothetical protein
MYVYDRVFSIEAQQQDIFDQVSGVVAQVLNGFNGSVMAYGQTSSGKTHTMEGPSLTDDNTKVHRPSIPFHELSS